MVMNKFAEAYPLFQTYAEAEEMFQLLREEYERSKKLCLFKRYRELERILGMFTSDPVLMKIKLLNENARQRSVGMSFQAAMEDIRSCSSFSSAPLLPRIGLSEPLLTRNLSEPQHRSSLTYSLDSMQTSGAKFFHGSASEQKSTSCSSVEQDVRDSESCPVSAQTSPVVNGVIKLFSPIPMLVSSYSTVKEKAFRVFRFDTNDRATDSDDVTSYASSNEAVINDNTTRLPKDASVPVFKLQQPPLWRRPRRGVEDNIIMKTNIPEFQIPPQRTPKDKRKVILPQPSLSNVETPAVSESKRHASTSVSLFKRAITTYMRKNAASPRNSVSSEHKRADVDDGDDISVQCADKHTPHFAMRGKQSSKVRSKSEQYLSSAARRSGTRRILSCVSDTATDSCDADGEEVRGEDITRLGQAYELLFSVRQGFDALSGKNAVYRYRRMKQLLKSCIQFKF